MPCPEWPCRLAAIRFWGRGDFGGGVHHRCFNTCRVNGYLLQIPACWDALCIGMKAIPCVWDYKLPYGFYYRQQWGPAKAEGFLEALRVRAKSGAFPLENRFFGGYFRGNAACSGRAYSEIAKLLVVFKYNVDNSA